MPGAPSLVLAQNPPSCARLHTISRRGGGVGGGWLGCCIVERGRHSRGAQTTAQDTAGEARPAMVMWCIRQATLMDIARALSTR